MTHRLYESKVIGAVLYARVSSKDQEREGYSIPAQQKLLRQYASEHGFEIVREFEEAETAKSTGRTQFNQMLTFLRNPKNNCRTILVEKTDRLYRNLKDWVVIDELDVEIHFVKEGEIISVNAHSSKKFLHGIKVLMAKQYIDNLSEEVRKGFQEKAEQGRYPAGRVPFGYYIDKNAGKIVVDQERTPLVREMFTLYAENKVSLQMLAAWARRKSVVNRNGKRPITKSQIERILKHRFYLGEFEWCSKVYKGEHEAIISRQLFEAVQQAFRNHNKPHYETRQFAFGDLITCTTCGCKITAQIKKSRYVYYHCTGMRGDDHKLYIPEPRIAEQFGEFLDPLALSKDNLKTVFDNLSERHSEHSFNQAREQARLSNRLTQLEKWIEQAYIDKLEGKITEGQWQSLTRPWQLEAESLRTLLSSNSDDSEVRLLTANRILELCQRLPVLWDRQDFSEKRKLVDLLYSNCQLEGRTLSLTYRKPFSYIAEGHKTQNWLGVVDYFRTAI